jgi:hypothetical protein
MPRGEHNICGQNARGGREGKKRAINIEISFMKISANSPFAKERQRKT